jgi:DNA-binding winged helix-turn-helix (wHTH) protein
LVDEARTAEEPIMIVWGAVTLAFHHLRAGDHAAAQRATLLALEAADASAVPWAVSTAHRVAGATAAIVDGWEAALPHFRDSVETAVAGGDMEGMAMTLRAAAGAAKHLADDDRATELWATIPLTQGIPVLRSIFHDHEEELQAVLGRPSGTDLAQLASMARALLVAGDEGGAVASSDGQVFRFEGTEVDVARHEVRRDGERVHVEPQVFDVLVHLLERAGDLVTKNDILDNVWGDRFVSEAALSSRIAFARKAVGDDGKQQRVIQTVHGRGFKFVAELR